MKSFAYLIPRIFLVGLIVLAAVLGADPLVRFFLISNLENSLGSKVKIAKISSDLADGKIYLRDFSIADPNIAMENLFQADLTYLKCDYRKLLDRQIAIDAARASHVRFAAPRTQPGNLRPLPNPNSVTEVPPVQFQESQAVAAVAWMDQFESKFSPGQSSDQPVRLFAVAKATNERWNRDFELHHQKLESVNQKIVQLISADPTLLELRSEQAARAGDDDALRPRRFNPLRLASAEDVVPELLNETVAAIDELKRQQLVLKQNAQADIEALDVAFGKDMASNEAMELTSELSVLPQTINDLLLLKFHQRVAADAVKWFAWLEKKSATALARRQPDRGVEFFVEHFSNPNLVINQLEIDGEGTFAEEHFHFAGQAFDLSNHPAGHHRPARFEIRAQGEHHFRLDCVIDRRQGRDQNKLVVEFPGFDVGEQLLGTENELLISLSPGTKIGGTIELNTDQNKLTGVMTLDFSSVALVVQHLHDVAGGREIEVRLNQQLSTLNHFQTTTRLTGDLQTPSLVLESDLGNHIAAALEAVSQKTMENSMLVRSQRVKEFYRSRVLPLQENIRTEVGKIAGALNDQVSKTETIQNAQRTANSRWPDLR